MSDPTYEMGLRFRAAILEAQISPSSYGGILRDLAGELDELLPALRDLVSRQGFQRLPLQGSPAEQLLARDALIQDLAMMYRDAVLHQLLDFLEGVLGFVETESIECETHDEFSQEWNEEDWIRGEEEMDVEPTINPDWIDSDPVMADQIDHFNEVPRGSRALNVSAQSAGHGVPPKQLVAQSAVRFLVHLLIHSLAIIMLIMLLTAYPAWTGPSPILVVLSLSASLAASTVAGWRVRDVYFVIMLLSMFLRAADGRSDFLAIASGAMLPVVSLLLSLPLRNVMTATGLIVD